MTRIFLTLLLLCFSNAINAQTAAAYSFTSLPSPFTSIATTGTAVPTLSADNVTAASIPIGFTFLYCGTPYTTLSACSNGWVSLTESPSVASSNLSGLIDGAGWLMPFWDDLDGTSGTAYYETSGVAPNRIFTFEWNNWETVSGTGRATFQVRLYETYNLVDFHYGPTSIAGANATIGISNDNVSDWQTLSDASITPTVFPAPVFETTVPTTSADGRLFRWTPSDCPVSPITGVSSVCTGGFALMSSISSGLLWSSSDPSVATITAGTGAVTGISVGTTTITYMSPLGCYATKTLTVTGTPPITGTFSLCTGVPETFTHVTPGGTWSSSNTAVATVGVGTGVVDGVSAGTARITYRMGGGCKASVEITVNTSPAPITGTTIVCEGSGSTLSTTSTGGFWSSSDGSIASVDGSGNMTGITDGSATISYTLPSGCASIAPVTINPVPAAITGSTGLCIFGTTPLSSASAGGTWTSSSPAIATIDASGLVTAGPTAGSSVITYTLPSGCFATTTVNVVVVVAPIVGSTTTCRNEDYTYSNASPGGVWSSSNPSVGTIDAAGSFTPLTVGTTTISYTLGSGCLSLTVVTVNPNEYITGVATLCQGATTTMSNPLTGGTWSSSDASIFTVHPSTGDVTGVSGGTATLNYTNTNGCTTNTDITVNPTPSPITGNRLICVGNNTLLGSMPAGGTWSSGNIAVASIGSSSGDAFGITAGTADITYTSASGCVTTAVLTVSPTLAPIVGDLSVCPTFTSLLTHPLTGGTWTSSDATIATVGFSSGILAGVNPSGGTATITYSPLTSGCFITATATVLPTPAISVAGSSSICVGATATVSTSMSGSTWTSSNASVATVSTLSGLVTGISGGTTSITCFGSNGCNNNVTFTVNTPPSAISGPVLVCPGTSITLSSSPTGGTWSSSTPANATVGAGTGVVTGIAPGTTTITYTLPTGCTATTEISVLNVPVATITPIGDTVLCPGDFVTLTSSTVGGATYQWYKGGTPISGALTPTYVATTPGNYQVRVSVGTGCGETSIPMSVSVVPAVANITVPGTSTTTCAGTPVVLNANTGVGLTYQWELGGTPLPGATMDTHNATTSGTYTVRVTNSVGCWAVSSPVTISVLPAPANTVTTSGPLSFCIGSNVTLTAATGTGYTYQWFNSAGTIAGATSAAFTTTTTESYHAIVTSPSGCVTNSDTSDVIVNTLPDATIASTGPHIFCAGGFVSLVAAAGFNYQWYRSGSPIAGATNAAYVASTSGGYRVKVTNATTGCSSLTGADTVVTAISTASVVPLTPAKFCWGGSSLLSTSLSGLGAALNYQWSFNGVVIPGATSTTYNASVTGNYECSISVPTSCTISTGPLAVTEMPLPDPPISFNGTTLRTDNYYISYQWYKNLVAIPGAVTYHTPSTGIGNYKVAVTDTNGCQSVSAVYVVTVSLPTDVVDVNSTEVKIFPNPAQKTIHIECMTDVRVVVSGIDGRKLISSQDSKNIDISALADGMYIITVFDKENTLLKTQKIIKKSE